MTHRALAIVVAFASLSLVAAAALADAPTVSSPPLAGSPARLDGGRPDEGGSSRAGGKGASIAQPESPYPFARGVDGTFGAQNPRHGLRSRVTPDGVELSAETPLRAKPIRLRLERLMRGDARAAVGPGTVSSEGQRAEIARPELHLVEWYVNDESGVEQGFTFARAPLAGAGDLVLRIALDSGRANLTSPGSNQIELVADGSNAPLRYAALVVRDARGRSVRANMGATGDAIEIRVDDRDAEYPIVVDPLTTTSLWAPEGTGGFDHFAAGVSTAGDVNCDGISDLAIGSPYDDPLPGGGDSGWVGVWYGRTGAPPPSPFSAPDWSASGPFFDNHFGEAVVAAGDVNGDSCDDLLIGAPRIGSTEAAYLFLGHAGGPSSAPDWKAVGFPGANQFVLTKFAASLAAGDVNGDGFADIIVGQPLAPNGQSEEGAIFVWLGNAGIASQPDGTAANADWRAESNAVNAHFGAAVSSGADVNGDGFDDVVVGAPDYAGEGFVFAWYGGPGFAADPDGTPANADWQLNYGQAGAKLGAAVAIVGDLDGDGYADVAAGAPSFDLGPGFNDYGTVTVSRGRGAGLINGFFDAFKNGAASGGLYGTSLATAGDVNGDGRADLLVGEPLSPISSTAAGRAYLYLGRADFFAGFPAATVTYSEPSTINNVGDRARFGASVATAGDWNGDGLSDVVVGAPDYGQSLWGKAWLYTGGTSTVAQAIGDTRQSDQDNAGQGLGLGFAGDVNGDGFSDYVVGAPNYDDGNTDEGRFDMVYGGSCGPACAPAFLIPPNAFQGNEDNAHMGASVSGAGDVNGDGYSDVIVGTPEADQFVFPSGNRIDAGAARVYYGSQFGLDESAAISVVGGSQAGASLGSSVAGAGDVNGDGYADVIVGAPNFDFSPLTDCGRIYVYYGSASGLVTTANVTIVTGSESGGKLGISVASAGDVNRDGYSDVLVGATGEGAGDPGAAHLYLGGPTGLAPTPARSYPGEGALAEMGASVATAGDVNGDGYSDFLIGSPGLDAGAGQYQGRAYLYLGGATPPAAAATVRDGGEGEFFTFDSRTGAAVSSAGDVNGDGLSDVVIGAHWYTGQSGFAQGIAFVYHGDRTTGNISAAPQAVLQDCAESFCDFGVRVAQAGDSNGDGFSDIVVAAFKYTSGQLYEGATFLHFGNAGAGVSRIRQQFSSGLSSRIDLLGRADSGFQAAQVARSAAGRARMRVEFETKPLAQSFDGLGTTVVSDTSSSLLGTYFFALQSCAEPNVCHWRARVRPRSPLFPTTPWFVLPGNAASEGDLRNPAPDSDGDLYPDPVDNCPTIANASQADGDADLVGDVCDSCSSVANPRVAAGFLAGNPWATLTGGQRDDDHDGYGNRCDGKFPGVAGTLVGTGDLAQFRASNGRNRTLDSCGTTGTRPCAIFDLDEASLLIGTPDLGVFRTLNGKAPGPKCATCPLTCEAGVSGTCGAIP